MIKKLRYLVRGPGHQAFCESLPETLRGYFLKSYPELGSWFAFPEAAFDQARDLHALVQAAGLEGLPSSVVLLTDEDFREELIYVYDAPFNENVILPYDDLIEKRHCGTCGWELLYLNRFKKLTLTLYEPPTLPLFRPASTTGLIILGSYAAELSARGLLTGADLIPLEVQGSKDDYFVLGSKVDLGMPKANYYKDHCPECDFPRTGSGFFPIYQRPAQTAHVFYTMQFGEQATIVSGRLAREFSERLRAIPRFKGLVNLGWYPDQQEDSRLPVQACWAAKPKSIREDP